MMVKRLLHQQWNVHLGCRSQGSEVRTKHTRGAQLLNRGPGQLAWARTSRRLEMPEGLPHPGVFAFCTASVPIRTSNRNLCPCGQLGGPRTQQGMGEPGPTNEQSQQRATSWFCPRSSRLAFETTRPQRLMGKRSRSFQYR